MSPYGRRVARFAVVTALISGAVIGVPRETLLANASGGQRLRRGDFKDDFRDPDTNALVMHYRMVVPEPLPEKSTLGLIVAFHGLNGNEDNMTGFALRSARRVDIADQYVIMGGKSKGNGWAAEDDEEVLAWIEWVLSTYPIDRRRVHLVGMSNGGWMVKRFGSTHESLFASVSSYCGAGAGILGSPGATRRSSRRGRGSRGETRTEWYLVHGDADNVVSVESSRLVVKQLAQRGYRYVYREIDGADHGGVLGYPDVAADNFRFIHALRNKEIDLSKEELRMLASSQKQLKKRGAVDAARPTIAEIVRLGGPQAAPALKSALRSSDSAVRKAAIRAAGKVLFSREVALELIRLARDESPGIRLASFKALSSLANWRVAEARAFLVQTARKRSLGVGDRVWAVKGLERAARLMYLGWYEDKDIPWTLVFLLADNEAKVREAAFTALKKGVGETFGYRPDLPPRERRAAAAKWAAWCEKVAGRPR